MSMIDIHGPTCINPDVEEYFPDKKGFIVVNIGDDNYEVKKLIIDKISLVYGENSKNGPFDKFITSFSFEEEVEGKSGFLFYKKTIIKKVIKKVNAQLFTNDYNSIYSPKNYLELEDVGINKKDAFDRYFRNESRYKNYLELF